MGASAPRTFLLVTQTQISDVLFSHFRHVAMRNFNKYLDGNAAMVPFADEEYGLCKHYEVVDDKK